MIDKMKALMIIMYKRKKAVSEIVAVTLLSLIIISIGAVLIITFTGQRTSTVNIIQSQMSIARDLQQQPVFNLFYAIYNVTENTLYLLVNVGEGFMEVKSIYINNSLVNNDTATVYINGVLASDPQTIIMAPGDINEIKVVLPSNPGLSVGDTFVAKIITQTGISDTVVGRVIS